MNALRRRLAVAHPEGGLSLVELVTAMAITALALTMVAAFFTNIMRTTVNGRGDREAVAAAANAMDEISRVLRVATDISQAAGAQAAVDASSTSTDLTVYAYTDVDPASPVPSKVRFRIIGSDLVEQRTVGVLSGGYWTFTGATTTRTYPGPNTSIASPFAVGFVYYRDSPDPDTAPTPVQPATNALDVSSVAVTVTAKKQTWGAPGQTVIATTVLMPNTKAA